MIEWIAVIFSSLVVLRLAYDIHGLKKRIEALERRREDP